MSSANFRASPAQHALFLWLTACCAPGLAVAGNEEREPDWPDETDVPAVPQASEGELNFLSPAPQTRTLHSRNEILIPETGPDDGWVRIRQCYEGLDAVARTEIVYRYQDMRGLRVSASRNIGQVSVEERSVQLLDVAQDAALCADLEAHILYGTPGGGLVLRNGPFQRRFLDGYFPMRVTLDVNYPEQGMQYRASEPAPQAGFAVETGPGKVRIDSWFAGSLNIELFFNRESVSPGTHD